MGRQIQIRTTDFDNDSFRNYLFSTFKCNFYQSFAPTIEKLSVSNFNKTFQENSIIKVHFTEFHWEPEFSQTRTPEKLFYISNSSNAPVIEFSKTNWETNEDGRIYWSKYFSGNPEYNVEEFEIIYDTIVKWLKNVSCGKIKHGNINAYYLKGAWEKHLKSK